MSQTVLQNPLGNRQYVSQSGAPQSAKFRLGNSVKPGVTRLLIGSGPPVVNFAPVMLAIGLLVSLVGALPSVAHAMGSRSVEQPQPELQSQQQTAASSLMNEDVETSSDEEPRDSQSSDKQSDSDSPESPRRSTRFGPGGLTAEEMRDQVIASQPVVDLPTDERSVALIERFKARWDAMIERDFERVYEYATPEVRESVTSEQFAGRFGQVVEWYGVEPFRIDYIDDSTAEVVYVLDHSMFNPLRGETFRTSSHALEQWIYEAGEWWHQPQSANITDMAPGVSGQKP